MIYEFEKTYTIDTGDLTQTGTGSGVHLYKDVTLTFDITDRLGNIATTSYQINTNPSIGDMVISILDTGSSVIYPNYYSGIPLKSFTFSEQNNTDVFGSYERNFGILVDIQDNTAGHSDSEFYLYGNVPEISGLFATDKDGLWLYTGSLEESYDNYYVNDEYDGRTAQIGPEERYIILDVIFSNDPIYTRYTSLQVYSGDQINITGDSDSFLKELPIVNQSKNISFKISSDGLNYNTPYYFKLVPYGELGSGAAWTIGPHTIAAPVSIPIIGSFESLQIINGDETGITTLITGEIPTTGITNIDTIPINTYHSIDYVSKIKDDNCEIYGSKISLIITGCSGTGHSLSEYSISANSNVTFSTSTDANNVYLTAQVDTAPATYKLYKTSI
jgi:hypothetical protein